MCGIDDGCILFCDKYNYCVKMLALNSKSIIRYIRFKEEPFGIAQIQLTTGSTVRTAKSSSKSDEQNLVKNCLVVITFPWSREIVFIDLSKYPAVQHKNIGTKHECFAIEIFDDKIFTICSVNTRSELSYSLCIMSMDGTRFKLIGDYIPSLPYMTLGTNSIYLIESENNSVTSIDMEGTIQSRVILEKSETGGVSLNEEKTKVYVSLQNAVFEIDAKLSEYKKLFEPTDVNLNEARCVYFHRGKLFVTHESWTTFGNHLSVISLI